MTITKSKERKLEIKVSSYGVTIREGIRVFCGQRQFDWDAVCLTLEEFAKVSAEVEKRKPNA